MTGIAPLDAMRAGLADAAGETVGIAVSGGGDSVAALVLAVDVLGASCVAAVTVDHGLRPGSRDEAEGVAALCGDLGVSHEILRWDGPTGGNLQDAARRARLRLIGDWASRHGVRRIVLGHTLDDQAETVLMRLARGSGVDGLSAMRPRRMQGGALWLRPLLGVTRAALRDVLRARGVGWVEDPSNADPRFLRVRAREALQALAPLGIDAAGLAATAMHMQRAREALEGQTQDALDRFVQARDGVLRIAPEARALPGEIRDRLFAHLVQQIGGSPYRPRIDALQAWVARGEGPLGGCLLARSATVLGREARAVAQLRAAVDQPWDGRWRSVGPVLPGVEIGAMGEGGLHQLAQQARAGMHPHPRALGLPRALLCALPGIWQGERLIAAPLAFWPQGWRLDARPLAAIGEDSALSD
ncbi:MAG: tRNA lysidine(34) synthetase TilS [Paracoccaceae bacterium]